MDFSAILHRKSLGHFGPLTQFEQGTKQGGTYKCGACGCKECRFDDQGHVLNHKWRSLGDLQSSGHRTSLWKGSRCLETFCIVNEELTARGLPDTKVKRDILSEMLDTTLRGVVRVPALLLTNPTQPNLSPRLQQG